MRYVYPVSLCRDDAGLYVAASRDVPEALTEGESRGEALREMGVALGAALAGYAIEGFDIPAPSAALSGEYLVPVEALVAAKLALRSAMKEQGVSNTLLAERLEVSEGAVRRLVDPDHASRLEKVVAALAVLGHSLIIEDQKQSAA